MCVRARAQLLHCFRLLVTPWTVVCQAALPMEFSRQEDWNGVPFPTPGHLPNPGIGHESLVCPALAGRFFTTSATREAPGDGGPDLTCLEGEVADVWGETQ